MLSEIIAHKKKQYKTASLENIKSRYEDLKAGLSEVRSLIQALSADRNVSLIAEIKRQSPSKGILKNNLDVESMVQNYENSGAAAISVLTDEKYFGGSDFDLISARFACPLPILRKDFIICEYQVYESRLIGADAILLIVAALDNESLATLHSLAVSIGLEVLMEVHDDSELESAIASECRIIGVNNRNLRTFDVDIQTSINIADKIPPDRVRISESGIFTSGHIKQLHDAGFNAVLVGESIITAEDPFQKIRELTGYHAYTD